MLVDGEVWVVAACVDIMEEVEASASLFGDEEDLCGGERSGAVKGVKLKGALEVREGVKPAALSFEAEAEEGVCIGVVWA